MSVRIDRMVWIPYRFYNRVTASALMASLTFSPLTYDNQIVAPIEAFIRDEVSQCIGVPMHIGLQELQRLGILSQAIVNLSQGNGMLCPPRVPVGRDVRQAQFMLDLENALRTRYTVLATMSTGGGKTVCALRAMARLNAATIVIVDSRELVLQWRERIHQHLGLPDSLIGEIVEDRCVFRGKQIVLAVIHNLVQKRFANDFYSYFGGAIWDEAQILGARVFTQSLPLFNCRYRLAITATPYRWDGCFGLVTSHFGEPSVVSTVPAVDCDVMVITYRAQRLNGRIPKPVMVNMLCEDQTRNALIVRIVIEAYLSGRDFLVVSDRIAHLEALMEAVAQVVPRHEMGLFARQRTDANGVTRTEQTSDELRFVRERARVIFATYNMIEKGVDIPRLSGGVDATPRSSATQLIGRIRREYDGKPRPCWWTIRDINTKRLNTSFLSRLQDYQKDPNITVYYGTP